MGCATNNIPYENMITSFTCQFFIKGLKLNYSTSVIDMFAFIFSILCFV